ncbi:MAG: hypothetical protein B7733_11130 [Myxococcales bacterium FL481]|nr:MAG: hypothetical protein B7733_11130 [Myxococcales bacterium FL481]
MMPRSILFSLTACASLGSSCTDTTPDLGSDAAVDSDLDDSSTGGMEDSPTGPVLAVCSLPTTEPSRLAIVTSDNATGAVGLADVATRTLQNDLALSDTDSVPFVHNDRVYVLHRFMLDYVDVLAADDLRRLGQFALNPAPTGSLNPHAIAFDPRGVAYVSLFGAPEVRVIDVSNPAAVAQFASIDMTSVADPDGNPELGLAVACGDYLWVAASRLDPDWQPVDHTRLVAIDTTTRTVLPAADGVTPGSLILGGRGVRKLRLDPRDPSGTTLLVLNTGLERVDLVTGDVSWVISDATFEAAGLAGYQLSQFDVAADGRVYFSAANADWTGFSIWRASLTAAGADLTKVVSGLDSVTGAFEVVGNDVWFLDTSAEGSGVRIFNLAVDPAVEVTTTPMSTGLPPYELVALP